MIARPDPLLVQGEEMKSLHAIATEINAAAVNYRMRISSRLDKAFTGCLAQRQGRFLRARRPMMTGRSIQVAGKKSSLISGLKATTMIGYATALLFL